MTQDEILESPDIQIVLVETGIETACRTAQRAIEAGKHVHLDKPGALSHQAFAEMRRLAAERGRIVQMGYMLRYNPAFQALFEAVRKGWLGEVLEVNAMMGKLAGDSVRAQIATLQGGGMFELGCHMVDAVVTILGRPESVSAFSTPSRGPADTTPDNQLAVLKYPKATATLRCNHADPFGGPRRMFSVTGTRGTFHIQPMESGRITLSLSQAAGPYEKGTQTVTLEIPKGRYRGEFVDMAAALNSETTFAWDAEHDIAVHDTALRASGLTPD